MDKEIPTPRTAELAQEIKSFLMQGIGIVQNREQADDVLSQVIEKCLNHSCQLERELTEAKSLLAVKDEALKHFIVAVKESTAADWFPRSTELAQAALSLTSVTTNGWTIAKNSK